MSMKLVRPDNDTSSQPAFHLRLAGLTDIPAVARCWYVAFFDDEVIGDIMHPYRKAHPEDVYYWLLRGVRERYFDWRHQFVVVVAEERGREKVIGAADWRRLGEGGRNRELGSWDPRNLMKPSVKLFNNLSLSIWPNRAMDPSRSAFLDSAVSDSEKHWTGDRAECWDLHVCGVHPDYHGRGVGRLLVGWGTQRADEEGLCASVICGEKNRGFYGKSGLAEEAGKPGSGEGGGVVLFRPARRREAQDE